MKKRRQHLDTSSYQALSLSCFHHLKKILPKDALIGTYISTNQEVDTWHIINNYTNIAVPKIKSNTEMDFYFLNEKTNLKVGCYGILEPTGSLKQASHLDIMIVPVVAFNHQGYRLGMGGGYYDRYLKKHPCLKIGLAFSFQQREDFEIYPHDVCLDGIVTEKGVVFYHENYSITDKKDAL